MAYLRPVPTCIKCHKTAQVELIGQFNNSLGFFCKTDGNAALQRHGDIERKNWKLIEEAETPERKAELRKMLA
jgi:hypothetical protein